MKEWLDFSMCSMSIAKYGEQLFMYLVRSLLNCQSIGFWFEIHEILLKYLLMFVKCTFKKNNGPMMASWRVSLIHPSFLQIVLRHFAGKSLPNPTGCWSVSSFGRLCSAKGIVSFGSSHHSGYLSSQICGQKWLVHRIVKITFHGLPASAAAWQVNHLDGDRSNNCLDNLEYVTQSENTRHSYSNPLRGRSGPAHSKMAFWRPVGATTWKISPSTVLAAQQLGMSQSTVSKCCRENSVAKGYEFKFQDPLQNTLPGEEWRPMLDPTSGKEIPGRMVSSVGRIMSKTGLVSRGHCNSAGYRATKFCINGILRNVYVHRLVAAAFLGPPPTLYHTCVNHKDLDKSNNAFDNLEWVSCAENNAHSYAMKSRKSRSNVKPVLSRP